MPFVSILKETGKRVCIRHKGVFSELSIKPARAFMCQLCDKDLYIRSGITSVVRPHFVHYPEGKEGIRSCNTALVSKPESREHREGKIWVHDYLERQIYETPLRGCSVEYEYYVKKCGRVADVMLLYPGGRMHAFEIQLSKISYEELVERTLSYEREGINVTWYLGAKAATDQNRLWLDVTYGESFTLLFPTAPPGHSLAGSVTWAEGLFGDKQDAIDRAVKDAEPLHGDERGDTDDAEGEAETESAGTDGDARVDTPGSNDDAVGIPGSNGDTRVDTPGSKNGNGVLAAPGDGVGLAAQPELPALPPGTPSWGFEAKG